MAQESSNSEDLLRQCLASCEKLGAKTELIPLRKHNRYGSQNPPLNNVSQNQSQQDTNQILIKKILLLVRIN